MEHSSSSPNIEDLVSLFKNKVSTFKTTKNDSLEFEIRFGLDYKKDETIPKLIINQTLYENVYKKLYSFGFKPSHSGYHMKVIPSFTNKSGRDEKSNVRIEINNLADIELLCRSNLLPDLENVNFVIKSYHEEIKRPFYNNNYGFRTSIQKETLLSKTTDVVKNIIDPSNWNNKKKTFRYIHRTSLECENMPHIRVDMSIVKSNYNNRQIRFKDSDVINKKPEYEIEIELVNVTKYSNYELIASNLKKTIKYILSGIQNTNYPKDLYAVNKTMYDYFNLIDLEKGNQYKSSKNFIGPSSKTLQKVNIIKDENINNISIQDEFCVTDKADGERKLLYISKNGEIYFITINLDFEYTGLRVDSSELFNTIIDGEHIEKDKFNNVINYYAAFDIYFCNIKKKSIDIRRLPFYITDVDPEDKKSGKYTRYRLLHKTIKGINSSIKSPSINSLRISVKDFKFSKPEKNETIFNCCNRLLTEINSNSYSYNTDGIIFTSKLLGVTQESKDDEIKNYKYAWNHSFKWKPPEYNTIDFLISIKKDKLNKLEIKSKKNKGESIQYYELELYVGFDIRQHKNKQNVILNLDYKQKDYYNRSSTKYYKPELFYPTNPSNENAHICHIKVKPDQHGNLNIFTEDNDIIMDDTIVEFKYEFNKDDKFMCWKPIRIRHDKTSEYKSGTKNNFGNAYHVANNNWQSIHNPITEEILSGKKEVTLESINEETEDVYYNGIKTESKTQPLRDFHNRFVKKILISVVSSKQNKTKLIDMAVGKGGDLSKWVAAKIYAVLGIDISKDNIYNTKNGACARYISNNEYNKSMPICMFIHGDTSKLIHNGDFTKIQLKQNSSSMKIIEQKYEDELINEEDIQEENISNIILNGLMGHGKKEQMKYEFLIKNFGIFHDKFDVCSIQFALHYMFENKQKLHSFLCNVSNYTKKGKYFIGTCYDGKKIYEELRDLEMDDSVEKYIDKRKIWHVKKKYNDENNLFNNDDENSIGLKISVYQETINKEFDEYLVNFDYFIKLMEDYGFQLSEPMNFGSKQLQPINNFESLYDIMMEDKMNHKQYKQASKMSEEEKYISFLNNYFIFQKVNNVNTELLYNYYVLGEEQEELDLTIKKAVKTNIRIKLNLS